MGPALAGTTVYELTSGIARHPAPSRAARRQRHAVDVLDLGHEQLLHHPRADRGVRRILPQVVELTRAGFQIAERAPSGAWEEAEPGHAARPACRRRAATR